ncbi:unnamed protein product [Clavelina lepadiformis]|uniref:DNA polymerase kappa n=1 Tax=Clavelina lepadiformis TaxID=159417 RepID=A0ABP0GFT9_CLALP
MPGTSSVTSRMALNDNKAGMEGLDKEKINKIIMENTIGSRYYKNEVKREAHVRERIKKMKERLQSCTSEQKENAIYKADAMIAEIEKGRDLTRTIIHIDMDAFYASVEERDKPELKKKPMAVGGMNMLSTSNYVARRYGVRAAMPGFIAKKLCPDLVIVPLNFSKYKEVSKEVQKIFAYYDPNFSAMSLDEAYMDVTEHLQDRLLYSKKTRSFAYNVENMYKRSSNQTEDIQQHSSDELMAEKRFKSFGFTAADVAEEIRFRIHQKTRLTASAGVGPNTLLAKIASDFNKPNGQTIISSLRDEVINFMANLPIRKVNGIGKVSEQLLSSLDIKYCKDLLKNRSSLMLLFSPVSCSFFLRTALGCSSNRLEAESERKSISTERTFNACSCLDEQLEKLKELCQTLSNDMKKANVQGKTITLKTKTVDFELHTRSRSTLIPVSSVEELFEISHDLLKQEVALSNNNLSLRLMGIGLSKLEPISGTTQTSIKKFFGKIDNIGLKHKATEQLAVCGSSHSLFEKNNIVEELDDPDEVDDKGGHCNPDELDVLSDDRFNLNLFNDKFGYNGHQVNTDSELVLDTTLLCPVCGRNDFENLQYLNEHLDLCLCGKNSITQNEKNGNHKEIALTSKSVSTAAVDEESYLSAIEANKTSDISDTVGVDFTCPICSVKFNASQTTLKYFNTHVDSCLNRKVIKNILQTDSKMSIVSTTKAKASKDGGKPKKRRKIDSCKGHTIDKFFS